MQALGSLALIVTVLGGKTKQVIDARVLQLGEMVAKRARLRCTAARARDEVPTRRVLLAGRSGPWIGIHNGTARQARQIDGFAIGGLQAHGWKLGPHKMPSAPIVL